MAFEGIDLDTRTQEILLAASNHDLETLKPFLRVPGAASVQDPETGFTPLHAAIAACGLAHTKKHTASENGVAAEPTNGTTNGRTHESNAEDEDGEEEVDMANAKATVRELFLSGAIWNDLDTNDETPGCLAWRLGQKELYELVVEAGVRAELLMNLMGGYEQLADDDHEAEDEDEDGIPDLVVQSDINTTTHTAPSNPAAQTIPTQHKDVNSEDYLKSTLTFTDDKLLDADTNGVMMAWETPIMALTASLLAPTPGLRILNIGFGLGIIDRHFAATSPFSHHIIEAHPNVLAKLQNPNTSNLSNTAPDNTNDHDNIDAAYADFGPAWIQKGEGRNVIHPGRWQDIVPHLLEAGEIFDVIYFDTFGEDYTQLKLFFSEYVVGLLAPEGRFGFFNGLGADRRVCYDVYCRVVELDLCDAGLDVEWTEVDVELEGREGEGDWRGVRRRYWTLSKYRLPVCRFLG